MSQLLPYETIVNASLRSLKTAFMYSISFFRLRSDGAFGKSRACHSSVRTITDGTGNHFPILLPTMDA